MNLFDILFGRKPSASLMDMATDDSKPNPMSNGFLGKSKSKKPMKDVNLQVTLWPTFPHFNRFVKDDRLQGIRMNSAMIKAPDLAVEIAQAKDHPGVPLWFDVKGRQLRITEVIVAPDHLEIKLNHNISCVTPTPVLFKAAEDAALLVEIKDGNHLIFEGGPHYMVYEGESIHIRHPSLKVSGPIFVESEIEKIERVKAEGFDKWYLSYVEGWDEVREFQNLVGKYAEIRLKIESKAGLRFVATEFEKKDNLTLVAARGDLFVEVNYPHEILKALRMIIRHDPEAIAGSRMLLSLVGHKCKKCSDYQPQDVPSCSDLGDLAWMYDLGYRNFLLCDELCLKEDLLAKAVNVFDAFRSDYCGNDR